MSQPIRLGIIGLGRAAAAMLPSLHAHPGLTLAGAADPNALVRARFEELHGGPAFSNAEDMLASGLVDAVYIASPHQFHVEHALAAAGTGKHFIVEKPLALTLADCQSIVDAARIAGVVSLVGHTHGFNPAIRAMRRVIESGEIGRLRMLTNIVYTDFLYRPRRPEELDTRAGGGIMFNQVPHQIEIVRVLAREPVRCVRASSGAWDSARPTEGAMAAFIEFDSGVTATLTYSAYDHFDSDEFCSWIGAGGQPRKPAHGSARRALLATAGASELQARTQRGLAGARSDAGAAAVAYQPHFGELIVTCERADMRISPQGVMIYGDDGVRELKLPEGRSVPNRDAVADDFVDAVTGVRAPLQDAAWGLQTMEVALALMRSATERREIHLRPA